MIDSGLNVRVIGTLIVGMLQIICGHPAFAQQTPPERQTNATGYGPSIEIATKNALSNAVAAICGQRIIGSQNLENLSRTQSALDTGGKDVSFEQSKTTQDNINAISDGLIEKFEILDQRDWNDQKKVDVSVTVSKCYNLDGSLEGAQTNKLLSSILGKIEEKSDPRGIREDDDKWDIMAKEMWYANFSAYMRQGQFKNEDQAKMALERGLHNSSMLDDALDREIISKLDLRKMSNLQYLELLKQLSENNYQYGTNLLKAWHRFKSESDITIEIIEKCGSRAQFSFFSWGNSEFEKTRILHLTRKIPECKIGGLYSKASIIGIKYSELKKINDICAELELFLNYDRSSDLVNEKINPLCSKRNRQLSEAIENADNPSLTASQRLAILADFPNAYILADLLNIKHSRLLESVEILKTAQLFCKGPYVSQPLFVLDRGPRKTRADCEDGLPIRFSPRPSANGSNTATLLWGSLKLENEEKGSLKLDAGIEEDRKLISKISSSFCVSMKELKIHLTDKKYLSAPELSDYSSYDDFFALFCS